MLKSFYGYVFWTLMMIVLSIMLGCDRQSAIDYFGQEPPGSIPKILAPGFISTEEHGEMACTFMPDGREFYFTRTDNAPGTQRIMVSRFVNGVWTKPEVAPFSREYVNLEPHITPDGRRLVFVSERQIQGQPPLGGNQLWVMERTRYGWGEPRYIRPGMFASVALDGTLYYTDMSNWPNPPGIVSSKLVDGEYTESQVLDGGVNSPMFGAHPCVAPDQSFIIFDSFRRDGLGGGKKPDLYVSFRKEDGSWGPALNLGDNINHTGSNLGASLSPDGKHLFFSSEGDIYWVDAKIIEKLKKESNPPEGSGVIAFSITPLDGDNEIYTVNADSSGLQQLTDHQGRDCTPSWSPDSKKLRFPHFVTVNSKSIS